MSNLWLETSNLCRHFTRGTHTVKAVDDVDLSVDQGEFLGIVGASGSGKSTLLGLMAGLDSPTSGHIAFKGSALDSYTRRELSAYRAHRVGMVFQSFNLIGHRTALKNVELGLYFNDTPRRERLRRASEMLERLGLADRLDHLPSDLSGGELQRVAMARALVKNPDILFADEPTGNLDHENSDQIAELLSDLNRRGLTVILVTHDRELARSYCHRTVKMYYGKLMERDDETLRSGGRQ